MRVRVVGAGAVRPWRVATLPAPRARADRLLVWLLPAAVLVAGRLVFTWLAAPAHLLVTLAAGCCSPWSPSTWASPPTCRRTPPSPEPR